MESSIYIVLEVVVGFNFLLFIICDGVLVNRKFFNLYKFFGYEEIFYLILNFYDGIRDIFFVFDVLYFLKIVRNCFSNLYLYKMIR